MKCVRKNIVIFVIATTKVLFNVKQYFFMTYYTKQITLTGTNSIKQTLFIKFGMCVWAKQWWFLCGTDFKACNINKICVWKSKNLKN